MNQPLKFKSIYQQQSSISTKDDRLSIKYQGIIKFILYPFSDKDEKHLIFIFVNYNGVVYIHSLDIVFN